MMMLRLRTRLIASRSPVDHNRPAARSKRFEYVVEHRFCRGESVICVCDENGINRTDRQVGIF
jgi:hypothetical protein